MNELKDTLKGLAWALIICALICMCASCGTTRYTQKESTEAHVTTSVENNNAASLWRDSLKQYQARLDSIASLHIYADTLVIRDSVVIIQDTAGQVVSREKYRDTYKSKATSERNDKTINNTELLERLQAHVDSLETLRAYTDTLARNIVIKEKVTAPLTLWQRLCITIAPWLLLAFAVLALALWIKSKFAR